MMARTPHTCPPARSKQHPMPSFLLLSILALSSLVFDVRATITDRPLALTTSTAFLVQRTYVQECIWNNDYRDLLVALSCSYPGGDGCSAVPTLFPLPRPSSRATLTRAASATRSTSRSLLVYGRNTTPPITPSSSHSHRQ